MGGGGKRAGCGPWFGSDVGNFPGNWSSRVNEFVLMCSLFSTSRRLRFLFVDDEAIFCYLLA